MLNKAREQDPPILENFLVFTIFQLFNSQVKMADDMGKHSETITEALSFFNNIDMLEDTKKGGVGLKI